MFASLAPAAFVLIWSTGFIVARATVPHASPELILAVRLTLTALGLAGIALAVRQEWPRGRRFGLHLLAGTMLNGFYLCLSWWAVSRGMSAGIMSLLGALQPLCVAVASFALFGERLPARGLAGLALALLGVGCVLAPALGKTANDAVDAWGAIAAVVAIGAMTAGTMIQRGALANDPIIVSGAIQNAGGALVAIAATLLLGEAQWDGSTALWLGVAWSVLALSGAGLSLLVWMVRHQGATRVSVLLLLVPCLAAIEAWWLFGERLAPVQIAGFALALCGVMLARTRPVQPIAEPA